MPLLTRTTALFVVVILAGCQSAPVAVYGDLATEFSRAELSEVTTDHVIRLRQAFLASAELSEKLEHLEALEQDALALAEDEPLKLGSLGTAILDTYYGSLTGHYALSRFYEYLENPEGAAPHLLWFDRITSAMNLGRDGSRESPYLAMTKTEARTFLRSQQISTVGSIYQTSEAYPFTVMLQGQRAGEILLSQHFDLTSIFSAAAQRFQNPSPTAEVFSPIALIGYLAQPQRNDTAAQAAIGGYLSSEGRLEEAASWLTSAALSGNAIANVILARIYWRKVLQSDSEKARESAMEEVLDNYLTAIALGSSDAMYALGLLYLNGQYGAENQDSGLSLLTQAAAGDHGESTIYLAHLYYTGQVAERDLVKARSYYAQAAALGDPEAQRSYARFLLDRDTAQAADERAITWLKSLAKDADAEAMVILGNFHARGFAVERNTRQAVRWFKSAVRAAPEDASVVNEVAWTLTVSDVEGLKRQRYALSIMEDLMTRDEVARARPEYLDTWAAAHAANGNFDLAIQHQEQALTNARQADLAREMESVVEVLEEHLEAFQDGQTITEPAP